MKLKKNLRKALCFLNQPLHESDMDYDQQYPSSVTRKYAEFQLETPKPQMPKRGIIANSSWSSLDSERTVNTDSLVIKSVRFFPKVRARDLPAADCEASLWYSKAEYRSFRIDMMENLEAFRDFCNDHDDRVCDEDRFCTRGLENYMNDEVKPDVYARNMAVLCGEPPEEITRLSAMAVMKARERAAFDEIAAREEGFTI